MRISPEPAYRLDRQNLLLRAGRGHPLFLFSGGGADLREMDPLVTALQTRRPLVGVPYWEAGLDGSLPTSVEAMADAAAEMVRSWHPNGPYLLAGYSLGGLVALEVARRLIDEGQSVRPPILIDALTHKSAWPLPVFVQAGIRYKLYHALRRRGVAAPQAAVPVSAELGDACSRCVDARAKYRPMRYNGRVALLHALHTPYIGGLAPAIWHQLALRVDCFPVAARHLELMRVVSVVATMARIVDRLVDDDANEEGTRRALVVTGVSWDTTARLARELDRVGFTVEAIAPAGHPIAQLKSLVAFYTLRPLNAQRSIESAIMESRPDILIPVDDFVTDLLHRLHGATTDRGVQALIERSLGQPDFYARKFDRHWMAGVAESQGVPVPRTVGVKSAADLGAQLEKTGCPAFLKVDGSWGGTGIARVEGLSSAKRAWRRLSGRLQTVRAIKRAIFNGDVSGIDRLLRRQRPIFSLQAAQNGRLVIVSAVCYQGELLGMLSARVLSQQASFGPATTIQMDDELPVREAVAKIIRRLGLSGFCGFDFLLPADSGACFIELNPRVTQTSDFIGEKDGDMLAVLLDSLGGRGRTRDNVLLNGTTVAMPSMTSQGLGQARLSSVAVTPADHDQ